MKTKNIAAAKTIIINATNVGSKPSGIGIYTLNMLKQFACLERHLKIVVYLNRNCHADIHLINFPPNITLRWVSGRMAPENRFKGHFLRLLYANYLSLKHLREMIFTTSQLEACLFRKRQVIMIHDLIPLLFRQYHKKQFYFFRYLLQYALRPARVILTPSHHTAGLLKKIFQAEPGQIEVIPNGTRQSTLSTGQPNGLDKPYLLFVGRLCPMKNIATLIRAFHLLRSKIPHRLLIVGEDEDYLGEAVRSGQLGPGDLECDRIEFLGHVDDLSMFELMKHADLFVFPSLAEGFGLPPLEAMACGCPVVASMAASLPEVCGDAAYYVDPEDAASIARGVLKVISDPHLRKQFVERGFQRVREYTWAASARQHLQVLRSAVGETVAEPVSTRETHPLQQSFRLPLEDPSIKPSNSSSRQVS